MDGVTGKIIVSFLRPLWTRDRKDVAGAVGTDLTLDQMADIVERVKIADTGFAFLAMSNGNVLAVNARAGEKTLGISNSSPFGVLTARCARAVRSAIAALPLDQDNDGVIQTISLNQNGESVPYIVVLKQLQPTNLWTVGPITQETMSVGVVVPEREIYAALYAAQDSISAATNRILIYQIIAIIVSMLIVFARRLRNFQADHGWAERACRCGPAPADEGLFGPRERSHTRRGRRGRRRLQPNGGGDQLPHGEP